MNLIVKVTDVIDRKGGKPTDYGVACYIGEGSDGFINLTAHDKPDQIKTATRLNDLAKRIKDTVDKFYSGNSTDNPTSNRFIVT